MAMVLLILDSTRTAPVGEQRTAETPLACVFGVKNASITGVQDIHLRHCKYRYLAQQPRSTIWSYPWVGMSSSRFFARLRFSRTPKKRNTSKYLLHVCGTATLPDEGCVARSLPGSQEGGQVLVRTP